MTSSKRNGLLLPLTLALTILFFLLMFPKGMMQVSAAEADSAEIPAVRVEKKTVLRGQTFELQIYLDRNPGLIALMLEIEYDETAMKLVGISHGDALKSHTFTTTNTETEDGFSITPFRMLWDGRTQDNTTGVLATLTFESNVDADIGDYPVSVSYDKQNTNVEYGKPCEVDIRNGCVTLTRGAFRVRYLNYDGSLLYEKDYSADAVPSYRGENPIRPTDECYSYEFQGWQGMVSEEPNVICYEAVYNAIPQVYQVFFEVDGEYFHAFECAYGESIDLSRIPSKKNHVFDGWYTDMERTQRVYNMKMPAQDVKLYGAMVLNVREDPVPEITLSIDRIEGDYAYVAVDVTKNPSISGLVLTLEYNRQALTFEGFERGDAFQTLQFDYTNTDQGYMAEPFRFYWEHTVNTTDTGRLLILKFKINHGVDDAVYDVTMTYDPATDAVYINEFGDVSYTKLNIIPISKLYEWQEEIENVADIFVSCPNGMPIDTVLRIEVVTAKLNIPQEKVQSQIDPNMEIKAIYSVDLLRNNVKVQPDGRLTIKIKLTEAQRLCTDLRVYHVDDNQVMTLYESRVEDGYIVFETDHLSYWAIVGNVIDSQIHYADGSMPTNSPIIITAFALLAISCMGFSLIMIAQKKNVLIAKSNKKGENNT